MWFGLFASLFVCNCGLTSSSRIFHSYGIVTITGEGLHTCILTNTWHLRPLSSESFLVCHTYYDTELPFIKVISEDPWQSNCYQAFSSRAVTSSFNDFGLSRRGFEDPTFHDCAKPEAIHVIKSFAYCRYRPWLAILRFLETRAFQFVNRVFRKQEWTGLKKEFPIVLFQDIDGVSKLSD